jgi:hypothetical protein
VPLYTGLVSRRGRRPVWADGPLAQTTNFVVHLSLGPRQTFIFFDKSQRVFRALLCAKRKMHDKDTSLPCAKTKTHNKETSLPCVKLKTHHKGLFNQIQFFHRKHQNYQMA